MYTTVGLNSELLETRDPAFGPLSKGSAPLALFLWVKYEPYELRQYNRRAELTRLCLKPTRGTALESLIPIAIDRDHQQRTKMNASTCRLYLSSKQHDE